MRTNQFFFSGPEFFLCWIDFLTTKRLEWCVLCLSNIRKLQGPLGASKHTHKHFMKILTSIHFSSFYTTGTYFFLFFQTQSKEIHFSLKVFKGIVCVAHVFFPLFPFRKVLNTLTWPLSSVALVWPLSIVALITSNLILGIPTLSSVLTSLVSRMDDIAPSYPHTTYFLNREEMYFF